MEHTQGSLAEETTQSFFIKQGKHFFLSFIFISCSRDVGCLWTWVQLQAAHDADFFFFFHFVAAGGVWSDGSGKRREEEDKEIPFALTRRVNVWHGTVEKPWNERIPCGLPHIPPVVLSRLGTTSFLYRSVQRHTQECGVSKHPRQFNSLLLSPLLPFPPPPPPPRPRAPPLLPVFPPFPSSQTERQWAQTIMHFQRHFL